MVHFFQYPEKRRNFWPVMLRLILFLVCGRNMQGSRIWWIFVLNFFTMPLSKAWPVWHFPKWFSSETEFLTNEAEIQFWKLFRLFLACLESVSIFSRHLILTQLYVQAEPRLTSREQQPSLESLSRIFLHIETNFEVSTKILFSS